MEAFMRQYYELKEKEQESLLSKIMGSRYYIPAAGIIGGLGGAGLGLLVKKPLAEVIAKGNTEASGLVGGMAERLIVPGLASAGIGSGLIGAQAHQLGYNVGKKEGLRKRKLSEPQYIVALSEIMYEFAGEPLTTPSGPNIEKLVPKLEPPAFMTNRSRLDKLKGGAKEAWAMVKPHITLKNAFNVVTGHVAGKQFGLLPGGIAHAVANDPEFVPQVGRSIKKAAGSLWQKVPPHLQEKILRAAAEGIKRLP
jgi:hypothetical protein